MSWTTTEALNTIFFFHKTALSLTQWLSHQHSSQLILMSMAKAVFSYPFSSGIMNRQQHNNIHLFLIFFEHVYSLLLLLLLLQFEMLLFWCFLLSNVLASYIASYKHSCIFFPVILQDSTNQGFITSLFTDYVSVTMVLYRTQIRDRLFTTTALF